MKPIASIQSCYLEKFGIPRQSGLVEEARARLVFEPEFRNEDAIRGLEQFSHVWLIWVFSENARDGWNPTVRPPRLGGNKRMGVFATRSPFRPNPIGLSAVKLDSIEIDPHDGPVLNLSGVDLMNGTPILDIKPYIPYADSIADASGGFADTTPEPVLNVHVPPHVSGNLDAPTLKLIVDTLSLDPRPSYQDNSTRIYGISIKGYNVRFRIDHDDLLILEITKLTADRK